MIRAYEHLRPSIQVGYARNLTQSAYPELWHGLEAAYVPSMQFRYHILRDFSGNRHDSTGAQNIDWRDTSFPLAEMGRVLQVSSNGATESQNYNLPPTLFASGPSEVTLTTWIRSQDDTFSTAGKRSHEISINAPAIGLWSHHQATDRITANMWDTAIVQIPSTDYDLSEWHHCTITARANDAMEFWIDNELVGIAPIGNFGVFTGDAGAKIGANRTAAAAQSYTGQIGPTYLFTRVLTSLEIQTLSTLPLAPFVRRRQFFAAFSPAESEVPPPAGLEAEQGSGLGEISLQWLPSTGALSYNVYRALAPGGPWALIAGTEDTSWPDEGLASGTTYYYRVHAVDEEGEGLPSNVASATTITTLDPPTSVLAEPGDFFGEIRVTWDDLPAAAFFQVLRSAVQGAPHDLIADEVIGTEFIDTDLTPGVVYYYTVTAHNQLFASDESDETSAEPVGPGQAPPRPITVENVSAIGGNEFVDLTWEPGVQDVFNWFVYKSLSEGGPFVRIADVGVPAYRDLDVNNDVTYYYYITRFNLIESDPSDIFAVTPSPGVVARRTGFFHVARIKIPMPVDYLVLRTDQNIWLFQVRDGFLIRYPYAPQHNRYNNRWGRSIVPYEPGHDFGAPRRLDFDYRAAIKGRHGAERIPRYLIGTNQLGQTAYLFRDDTLGTLVHTLSQPAGIGYPIGDGVDMIAEDDASKRYRFSLHSTQGFTLTQLSDGPTEMEVPVSTRHRTGIVQGEAIPHRLQHPINISSRFDIGSLEDFGQKVSRSIANDVSDFVIDNSDGRYDFLANLYLRGREVEAFRGLDPDPQQIGLKRFYKGIIDAVTWEDREIHISGTNPSIRFKEPLQTLFFGGTGGTDGTGIVEGRPYDIIYGAPIFFEPTLIDESALVYSLGDRMLAQVFPTNPVNQDGQHVLVRFVEQEINFFQDVYDWPQQVGKAAISPSQRLMRLGATPDGLVLVCLYAGLNVANQIHTPGQAIEDIIVTRMGMLSSQYDQTSINQIKSSTPQVLRLHFPGSRRWTREEVLDTVCKQFNGIWGFYPQDGRFFVRKLSLDRAPVAEFTPDDMTPEGITRDDPGLMPGAMDMGVNPTAREFTEQDVAEGAPPFNRRRAVTPFIRIQRGDGMDGGLENLPIPEIDFHVVGPDITLVLEDYRMYMRPRDIYRFTVFGIYDELNVGDVIRVSHPRYGLALGKDLIVIGLTKDGGNLQVEIEGWG